MFSKIQNKLLIENPLLWNIKFIPALFLTLIFHTVFFIIGYFNGAVDFSNNDYNYYGMNDGITIFFSVLVTILFFVLWFVYYFRNNAFKSFYNLKPFYLYKEFLLLLVICVLNITYSVSYFSGKHLKQRSYYSQEETRKRVETIVMASIFIQDSNNVRETYNYDVDSLEQINFQKIKYDRNSLINSSVGYFSRHQLTDLEIKVKTWMQNDNKAAIKNLMKDYFKLINEHQLRTNLSPEKWFELTYHYPEFTEFEPINDRITSADYDVTSINKNLAIPQPPNSGTVYYLPQNELENDYEIIYDAWDEYIIDLGLLQILLYVGLAFTMLIFSFKISDGRSWLIAFIGTGILSIVGGVFASITNGTIFLIYWLVLILGALFYYYFKIFHQKDKGHSGIALNIILWAFVGFLPLLYALAMQFFDEQTVIQVGINSVYKNTPQYEWLDANVAIFSWLQIVFVILFMSYFVYSIKKWKGLAES